MLRSMGPAAARRALALYIDYVKYFWRFWNRRAQDLIEPRTQEASG